MISLDSRTLWVIPFLLSVAFLLWVLWKLWKEERQ
jgi:hypothetical protein